jgi:acyl dehydratase
VSLGYDRLRFLKGVRIDDTITVTYTIAEIDSDRRRSVATFDVTNESGQLVVTGKHILKWVPI